MNLGFFPASLTNLFIKVAHSPTQPAEKSAVLSPKNRILEVSDSEFTDLLHMQSDPSVSEKLATLTLRVLNHCEIPPDVHNLPPNVEFMKDVELHTGAALESFNAKVRGTAKFAHLSALKSIGAEAEFENLIIDSTQLSHFAGTVNKDAVFKDTYLAEFAPQAKFNGNLEVSGSRFTRFNSTVAGSASFSGVKSLQEIGVAANIGKDLCVSHSGIRSFNGQVGGNADFYLTSQLQEIGSSARIGGNLIAMGSRLSKCEAKVAGAADFSNCTNLRKLAIPASFGGNVLLSGTQVEEVTCPVGRLEARNVPSLTTTTPGLRIHTQPEARKSEVNVGLKEKLLTIE